MEKNLVYVYLTLGILIVISMFSGTSDLTGRYATESGRGTLTCGDTDGFNVFVKGAVTTDTGGRLRQYVDECADGGTKVKEYYCSGNRHSFKKEWCPSGMICRNSKCE